MRKTIIASLAAFCLSNATERIVMSCNFDAVAKGYNSFTVQQDMLLTNRCDGRFLNDDGTTKVKSENIISTTIDTTFYVKSESVSFFDGKERHNLFFSRYLPEGLENFSRNFLLDSTGEWSVNSGNIKCSWEPVNE